MPGTLGNGNVRTVLLILVVIELAVILSLARNYLNLATLARHKFFNSDNAWNVITRPAAKFVRISSVNKSTSVPLRLAKMKRAQHTLGDALAVVSPRTWNYTSVDLPKESPIPRIVHMVQLTDNLTFRNYLSILSVYKILKPYRIILYIHDKFKPKQYEYNKWYQKALAMMPCLEVKRLSESGRLKMDGSINITLELRFVASALNGIGGVYVNLNTIINWDPLADGQIQLQIGITKTSSLGFITVAKTFNFMEFLPTIKLRDDLNKHNTSICVSDSLFTGSERCCVIQKELFPVDIMRSNSSFASLARYLFYGTSSIPIPQRSFPPIPKIIHYVWFGHRNISFSMFVSFRSTLRFVKPIKIIIYVDRYNLGYYFDEMRKFSAVSVVYYGTPESVFQKRITNPKHASDYVRTDVLLRFGGIYMDWDVFWLKPIDDLVELGYETIATFEHYSGMVPRQEFPDTINMGVVLARPGSRFISHWQDSFHEYTGEHATFHAIEMVYKIYEEHPNLLHIEKKLQVMCFKLKCHPLWLPNYKETSVHNDFNFTDSAYAVHFTEPVPIAFMSEEDMKWSRGYFADMARHVFGVT